MNQEVENRDDKYSFDIKQEIPRSAIFCFMSKEVALCGILEVVYYIKLLGL